ncbi:MAG: hypothetical protein DRQ57_11390 [Gammaproteobacteria bacterium]|nr:MAG: hypothetical protein DRQ57_11390 [Gammaproteobacteria bacterium]
MLQIKKTKHPIFLGMLLSLTGGCDNAHYADEPTSNLKPDNVEEYTEERKLATKMFTSVLTQLENGMVSMTIHRQDEKARLQLKVNHSEKTLHELCRVQETCVGGIYASVNNHKDQGEILHRVYKTQRMQIACAWLESYPEKFGTMNDALQQEVVGRAWHWVKKCFEE